MVKLCIILLLATVKISTAIDLMPCTERVDAAAMALANRLLEESVPPAYRLIEYYPATRTGMYVSRS